jgi:inorganic pyrophosphatase
MNLVHDLPLGKIGETINTVIEIPKGSMHKIEYDLEQEVFLLDRVEPSIFAKPVNYGFIPQTIDEDGDPLDTLFVTDEPLMTGIMSKAKVIGVLNFVDSDENDHKIICVPEDDRNTGNAINSLDDLNDGWKKKVEHHFNHYKDLKKPGSTKVEGWGNAEEAWKIIDDCNKRYLKNFKKN